MAERLREFGDFKGWVTVTLRQWRSKVSEGTCFNSNLGALPFLSPPSLPLEVGPQLRLGGLGERLSSPSGSGQSPATKRFLVHVQPIWRHFL